MFSKRSDEMELMDNLRLADAALGKNLQELEAVNRWLGGKRTLMSAFDKVYKRHPCAFKNKQTSIADLGCGGGDLLMAVHDWANAKALNVDLIGIDANPFMVSYAVERCRALSKIQFNAVNVLSDSFNEMRFDIVCLNTFCHHFNDPDLIALLRRLRKQATTAIIVNDLHRHWFAYLSIKWLTRMFKFSHLARHDGPLSVLRAFQKHELIALLMSANIDSYQIRRAWAFRWQVIIWNK